MFGGSRAGIFGLCNHFMRNNHNDVRPCRLSVDRASWWQNHSITAYYRLQAINTQCMTVALCQGVFIAPCVSGGNALRSGLCSHLIMHVWLASMAGRLRLFIYINLTDSSRADAKPRGRCFLNMKNVYLRSLPPSMIHTFPRCWLIGLCFRGGCSLTVRSSVISRYF